MVFADLKNDFVFRRVFGTRPDILCGLLNDLLERRDEQVIESIEYLPNEQLPLVPGAKLSILDVHCRDRAGTTFVVEMQLLHMSGFINRVVYNGCKAYVDQFKSGEPYSRLKDVIAISICDFILWPGQERPAEQSEAEQSEPEQSEAEQPEAEQSQVEQSEPEQSEPEQSEPEQSEPEQSEPEQSEVEQTKAKRPGVPMLSRWVTTEKSSGHSGLGQVQYAFLELPKLPEGRPESGAELWAWLFVHAPEMTEIPSELPAGPYREAVELANEATFTQLELDAYRKVMDEIEQARQYGADQRAEGEATGEARGEVRGKAEAILAFLKARGIEVSSEIRERILACVDNATLDRWIGRAAMVSSADEVIAGTLNEDKDRGGG